MNAERAMVDFIHRTQPADLPPDVLDTITAIVTSNIGTAIAGSLEAGVSELRQVLLAQGGPAEATVLVHGDRLPAASAALLNAVMARALDYEDALVPGLHLGASLVPTALACAELVPGASGSDVLIGIAVGAEVGARLNLPDHLYAGFDPTGLVTPLAATATAARILSLSAEQTLNALGLAFNRAGGSFQSNVDGSLAVRLIQGWAAETGILCARLAAAGLTGPERFLEGVYGYANLYGRGEISAEEVVRDLGLSWAIAETGFKKYPSCGLTQGATELALRAHADGVRADLATDIVVELPPYAYHLVGHPFEPRENPRVSAQFSARFCVASALTHGSSRLPHFSPEQVTRAGIRDMASRVDVRPSVVVEARGHGAVDLSIGLSDGSARIYSLDVPAGFPGNPLNTEDHERRLRDCVSAAPLTTAEGLADTILATARRISDIQDISELIAPLLSTSDHTTTSTKNGSVLS